jgi:hypothetical protein
VGDYVDTHENIGPLEQLENLREIIRLKLTSPKQVILLIGNHDYHYWPGVEGECYSGFQPAMKQSFRFEFKDNEHLFQVCFADERNRVYTHAGLTVPFIRHLESSTDETCGRTSLEITRFVNDCFNHNPLLFKFYGGDFSGYGNHERQGCLWVRPQSLNRAHIVKMQIVGHTTMNNINPPPIGEMQTYFIDALGTSGEYLFIDDNKINIVK